MDSQIFLKGSKNCVVEIFTNLQVISVKSEIQDVVLRSGFHICFRTPCHFKLEKFYSSNSLSRASTKNEGVEDERPFLQMALESDSTIWDLTCLQKFPVKSPSLPLETHPGQGESLAKCENKTDPAR